MNRSPGPNDGADGGPAGDTMVAPSQSSVDEAAVKDSAGPVSVAAASNALFVEETNPVFASRYQIVSLIGSGGMGTVYMARDAELDELVALKVLRKDSVSAPGALEMFRREVKLARRVTHPNVARTFDIGESDGQKYLTMEYVNGAPLSRMIEAGGLSLATILEVAEGIAAGLAAAHAVGVVHRDLKPENILVTREGRAVITDFGIARPVEVEKRSVTIGLAIGTPAYMAPEQVEAKRDIDPRADIYAFGVVLFELLTGDLPFEGTTALAVAAARLTTPPPDVRTKRPDVPSALADLVLRCMARDRDQRVASVAEISRVIAAITMPHESPSGVTLSAVVATSGKAIAVLPFRNAGTSEDAFLAEGLWDDLIDGLSMTEGLRVRPRASLAKHLGTDRDPAEIGRELGVDVVVEGSVRRAGDKLRVAARLLNVADGFQLWARRFDKDQKDAFALSDEIASAVAEALTIHRKVPERASPTDELAVELYLRAKAESRKLFTSSANNVADLFEQARVRAPNDPTILAGYAFAQVRRWFYGDASAFAKGVEAADRALAAAPHLHDARHARALFKLHSADHGNAIPELKQLAAQGFLGGHETLAGLCDEIGLEEESDHHIEHALRIDPASPYALFALARLHAIRGRWSDAEGVLKRASHHGQLDLQIELTGAMLRYMIWRGDRDRAIALLQSSEAQFGPMSPAIVASVLSAKNDGAQASDILRGELDPRKAADHFFNAANVGSLRRRALLHQFETETACSVGNLAWAIEALGRADAARLVDINWLRKCPLFVSLRTQPGYAEIEAHVAARAAALVDVYRS